MNMSETVAPRSIATALQALADRNAIPVAGGTDILVKLHDRIDKPWPRLVVLDNIKQLKKIMVTPGYIDIGATVTFAEIERSRPLKKLAPPLVTAVSLAGSVQIRNRATIGGNIANASPAGDTLPPLYAMDARIELRSANSAEWIKIADFFKGPGKTILRPDQLITRIRLPLPAPSGFFLRLAARRALAISKVSVAACAELESGKVTAVRIALGAVAPTVIRAPKTEKFLTGKTLDEATIAMAAEIVCREARPIDDIRSLSDYRKEMVGILLKRGLQRLMNGSVEMKSPNRKP